MPIVVQGQAPSGLDIFIKDAAGNLTDPTSITYDIIEPGSTVVANDVAGFKRSTGHYDARNTTIPSGFSTSSSWTITWTFVSPGGVTSSKSEEFSVVAALSASFTNADNLFELIRVDLDDSTLTDTQLESILNKSLKWLNLKLRLTGTSGELSYDDSTGQISPSPNSSIFSFIIMRMECLVIKRRQSTAIGGGTKIRDGDWSIDTTASFGGYKDIARDICGELNACIKQYLEDLDRGIIGDGGAAKHGSLIWSGNQRIFEDADYDGQAFETKDFRNPFQGNLGHFVNTRNC